MSAKTKSKKAETPKPETHVRVGGVRIAIWRNEGEDGPYFKAGEPELSYVGKDKKFHASRSYGQRDLINLVKAAALAHSELGRLNRELKKSAEAEDDTDSE